MNKIGLEESEEGQQYYRVKNIVSSYNSKVTNTWEVCKRTLKVFKVRHIQWFDKDIVLIRKNIAVHTSEKKLSEPEKADFINILMSLAAKG